MKYLSDRYGAENVKVAGGEILIDPVKFTLIYENTGEEERTTISCEYGIRIQFSDCMRRVPKVCEIHDKITERGGWHVNSDRSFCLDLPEVVYQKTVTKDIFSIEAFIESFIEPFLGWQEYHHLYGEDLWETRVHGNAAYIWAVMNRELSKKDLIDPMVLRDNARKSPNIRKKR